MAALAGVCCPPTRVALLAPSAYKGRGEWRTVSNALSGKPLRVYQVAGPRPGPSSRHALLLVPDIFGVDSGRHVGVADSLSDLTNATVFMADTFREELATHAMRGTPDFMRLLAKHDPKSQAPDLDCLYRQVISRDKFDQIGLVGFCWGVAIVYAEGARMADPRIKAGAGFHPSLGLAKMWGTTSEAMVKANRLPMLVCPCKDDPAEMKPGGILPASAEIHVFDRQNHGFMTQGDVSKADLLHDVNVGLDLAMVFFAKHLGSSSRG
jgi:dienelactone hydrolase